MSVIKDDNVLMTEEDNLAEEEKTDKKTVKRHASPTVIRMSKQEDKEQNDEPVTKVDEFEGRRRTRSASRGLQSPLPPPSKKERVSKISPKTKVTKSESANKEAEIKASTPKENNADEKMQPDSTENVEKNTRSDDKSTEDSSDNKVAGENTGSGENAISPDNKAGSGENTISSGSEAVAEKINSPAKAASGDAESVVEDKPRDITAANGETKSLDKTAPEVNKKELVAEVAE